MVEDDKYCIDILTQVSAATRALQSFSLGLLDEHLGHCVVDAAQKGGPEADGEGPRGLRRDRSPRPLLTTHPACAGSGAGSRKAVQMNTPTKLGTYALGLVVVFGASAGIGNAVGPVGPAATAHDTATHDDPDTESPMDMTQQSSAASGGHVPGGLQISENGYTLDLAGSLPAGAATPVSFRILGPDGRPVTAYDTAHDEDLHLIAVRRDLSGYQHVHPRAGARRHLVDPAGPDARHVAAVRRLRSRRGGRRARPGRRRRRRRRLHPGAVARAVDEGRGRRVHRHPRREPGARAGVGADPVGQPRRAAGHRPAALPGRLRAPGRAARRRPGLPARAPGR